MFFFSHAARKIVASTKFFLLCRRYVFIIHFICVVDCVVFYSERIDVEKSRDGRPLCMSQFVDMVSCCRIPGQNVDTQRRSPVDQSRHIIVAHNGHVSKITVYFLLITYCVVGLALSYQ